MGSTLKATRVNSKGDSGQPAGCLLLVECSRFLSWRIVLVVGVVDTDSTGLRNLPSVPIFCSSFTVKGCWLLSETFSASVVIIM